MSINQVVTEESKIILCYVTVRNEWDCKSRKLRNMVVSEVGIKAS